MGKDFASMAPTYIAFSGTAKAGTPGPPIGHVDIGESDSAYLFRVALPGVRKDESALSCEIERDGKVHLEGFTTGGELFLKNPKAVFELLLSQLSPPGKFSVSFKLPGPVDPRLFSPTYRSDGILEGVVMKYRAPGAPPPVNQFDSATFVPLVQSP